MPSRAESAFSSSFQWDVKFIRLIVWWFRLQDSVDRAQEKTSLSLHQIEFQTSDRTGPADPTSNCVTISSEGDFNVSHFFSLPKTWFDSTTVHKLRRAQLQLQLTTLPAFSHNLPRLLIEVNWCDRYQLLSRASPKQVFPHTSVRANWESPRDKENFLYLEWKSYGSGLKKALCWSSYRSM